LRKHQGAWQPLRIERHQPPRQKPQSQSSPSQPTTFTTKSTNTGPCDPKV
jgi:hypothetical protein